MFTGPAQIEDALRAVGELLAAEKAEVDIVVVGGATLNLLGIVRRTTRDVDVIARAHRDADGRLRLAQAEPFPEPLERAIAAVARDLGLDPDWLNADVGKQWVAGLPPGIEHDVEWRTYGGLRAGLVQRRSLIALKLFAAVDQGREASIPRICSPLLPRRASCASRRNGLSPRIHPPNFRGWCSRRWSMSNGIVPSIRRQVRETAAELAWAQWSGLTAAAAAEHAPRAMVDPEALVLLSLAFQDYERRLRDLVYGLACAGTRLLSVQRMTAIAAAYSVRAQEGMRHFAWAAAEAGDHRWHPHGERPADDEPRARAKSIGTLRLNNGPSLVLRLRAGLGVGVKADVLALLLGLHGAPVPVKVMALATGYTSRGLRKAAEEMAVAGFVKQSAGTPVTFAADHRAWAAVLQSDGRARSPSRGGVPAWRYWSLVFAFFTAVDEWGIAAEQGEWSDYVASSRARDLVQDHAPRLQVAGILLPDPREASGAAYLDEFAVAMDRLAAWCIKHV